RERRRGLDRLEPRRARGGGVERLAELRRWDDEAESVSGAHELHPVRPPAEDPQLLALADGAAVIAIEGEVDRRAVEALGARGASKHRRLERDAELVGTPGHIVHAREGREWLDVDLGGVGRHVVALGERALAEFEAR